MATAGNQLIRGLDPVDIAGELDRLYCYEQVSIHWARAIDNRFGGLAEIVLEEPLRDNVALAEGHSSRLSARVSQLGGAITADPTQFIDRSQHISVEMPDDTSEPAAILTYALTQQQKSIGHYASSSTESAAPTP